MNLIFFMHFIVKLFRGKHKHFYNLLLFVLSNSLASLTAYIAVPGHVVTAKHDKNK